MGKEGIRYLRNAAAGRRDSRSVSDQRLCPLGDRCHFLGIGTAMVYPTLLATIGDVAHPEWRGTAVGVYRLWRDGGYAIGALLAGFIADLLGLRWAIGAVGALTILSGLIAAVTMRETLPRREVETGISTIPEVA